MSKQILLYAPVVHRGIEEFISRHLDATEILLLGKSFSNLFPWMVKDVRAVDPHNVLQDLAGRFRSINIRVVEEADLGNRVFAATLVFPDEELSRQLIERFNLDCKNRNLVFDQTWLRWDRVKALSEEVVTPDGVVSADSLDVHFMGLAQDYARLSSDWWRQVGAVISVDRQLIVTAFNKHMPSDYSPYIDGDPRGSFKRGDHIELTTAIHAEAGCIGWCARYGQALLGASIYTTTFPCPVCARLIVAAGITSCYYAGGYSMLDGLKILQDAGIKLICVK